MRQESYTRYILEPGDRLRRLFGPPLGSDTPFVVNLTRERSGIFANIGGAKYALGILKMWDFPVLVYKGSDKLP